MHVVDWNACCHSTADKHMPARDVVMMCVYLCISKMTTEACTDK